MESEGRRTISHKDSNDGGLNEGYTAKLSQEYDEYSGQCHGWFWSVEKNGHIVSNGSSTNGSGRLATTEDLQEKIDTVKRWRTASRSRGIV